MNLGQQRFQVSFLLGKKSAHVRAGSDPGASEADDLLDFRERQPEAAPLLDEVQYVQHIRRINPVTRCRSERRRQDAARFVEPQCLPGHAAALDNLTNPHGATVNPVPWGRVKP